MVNAQILKAIDRFEEACRMDEIKGAMIPPEDEQAALEYDAAKTHLLDVLQKQ